MAASLQRPKNVDDAEWAQLQAGIASIGKDVRATGVKLPPQLTPQMLEQAKPEDLGNDPAVEIQWAMKAGVHAETYMKLLRRCPDRRKLRLTKHDEQLYDHFRQVFPSLKISHIHEDRLKTAKAQKKWRAFLEQYKGVVKDYNMGTLIRRHSNKDFSQENSLIVPRTQFYAIEVARNREGLNDNIVFDDDSSAESKK